MVHQALLNCPLFSKLSSAHIAHILTDLHATEQSYSAGSTLIRAGTTSTRLGIVLSGNIEAWRVGIHGTEFLSAHMTRGGVFGDLMAACGTESPVTVRTGSASRILWISYPALPALFLHGGCQDKTDTIVVPCFMGKQQRGRNKIEPIRN